MFLFTLHFAEAAAVAAAAVPERLGRSLAGTQAPAKSELVA